MKLAYLAVAAALAAAPAARADVKLRLGAEAVLAEHHSGGWNGLTDRFLPSVNVMVGWMPFSDFLSLDAELSEQFLTNPGPGEDSRQGTTLRLGVTISPPVLPIYIRGAIPLHLEPSPFQSYARVGAGLGFNFALATVYAELDADFPLAGGSKTINGINVSAPDAFSQQIFSAGAGVQFKF